MSNGKTWKNLELRFNANPLYTDAHVDHQEKHGAAYGHLPPPHAFAQQRAKIRAGNPDRRHHPGTDCFDILVDGSDAGSVVVSDDELLMVVFDSFSDQGIGSAALKKLLETAKYARLSATVRSANPNPTKVVKMLKGAGFREVSGGTGGDTLLEWRKSFTP